MPTVHFTQNLQRHVGCDSCQVEAHTVRVALRAVFATNPKLESYVLDDRGAVRKHMVVFVDGEEITDRTMQADPVGSGSEIFVMQALSGG